MFAHTQSLTHTHTLIHAWVLNRLCIVIGSSHFPDHRGSDAVLLPGNAPVGRDGTEGSAAADVDIVRLNLLVDMNRTLREELGVFESLCRSKGIQVWCVSVCCMPVRVTAWFHRPAPLPSLCHAFPRPPERCRARSPLCISHHTALTDILSDCCTFLSADPIFFFLLGGIKGSLCLVFGARVLLLPGFCTVFSCFKVLIRCIKTV